MELSKGESLRVGLTWSCQLKNVAERVFHVAVAFVSSLTLFFTPRPTWFWELLLSYCSSPWRRRLQSPPVTSTPVASSHMEAVSCSAAWSRLAAPSQTSAGKASPLPNPTKWFPAVSRGEETHWGGVEMFYTPSGVDERSFCKWKNICTQTCRENETKWV